MSDEEVAVSQALLAASREAILLVDSEGWVLFANPAAQSLMDGQGARQGEARKEPSLSFDRCGRPQPLGGPRRAVWDLFPPARRSHIRMIRATGAPIEFVDRCGEAWYEVRLEPLPGPDGALERVALYARDVTRQIEAEEGLKNAVLRLVTSQEDERRRIAQELHDDIGQRMTALQMGLKAAGRAELARAEGVPPGAWHGGAPAPARSEELRAAIAMAEDVMKQLHRILYQLRPPLLASQPLARVLGSLCSTFAASSGLRVDFSGAGDLPSLSEAQALVLYRCAQEGLNNSARHARGTSVWVSVDCVDGEINISIEDDGQGFEPPAGGGPGLGLQGIRDRFVMLGGTFAVESAPGRGTRLCGTLPVGRP